MPYRIFINGLVLFLSLLLTSFAYAASPAGEIVFTHGLNTVKRGDQVEVIGKGSPLMQGDEISTDARGIALIRFSDDTRMTLRPQSRLVLNEMNITQGEESMLLDLLKGGFRAVTGFIKKRGGRASIKTPNATIGIRGTDFDARLCDDENPCEGKPYSSSKAVVARVALIRGDIKARSAGSEWRQLSKASPLYEGDEVVSHGTSYAMIVFRDESKVLVRADSYLRIDSFNFDSKKKSIVQSNIDSNKQHKPDSFSIRLLKGGFRMLTGLISKRNPNNVRLTTATATIGIRGTLFDVDTGGKGLEFVVRVFEGGIWWEYQGVRRNVDAGGVDCLARRNCTPTDAMDNDAEPRPDQVPVDMNDLFGTNDPDKIEPGLYVDVRDGEIVLVVEQGELSIGAGESGYAGKGGVWRIDEGGIIPYEPTPHPDDLDERTRRVIEFLGLEQGQQKNNNSEVVCEVH